MESNIRMSKGWGKYGFVKYNITVIHPKNVHEHTKY